MFSSRAYFVALVLSMKICQKSGGKYKRILDREDKEFRRAMEEDISTLLSSKFSNKYRILAGVDTTTQNQIDLPIFKQCLALPMIVIKFRCFHSSLGVRPKQ